MVDELKEKVNLLSEFLKKNNMQIEVISEHAMVVRVEGYGHYYIGNDVLDCIEYDSQNAFHRG